jgi:hypothetical protein
MGVRVQETHDLTSAKQRTRKDGDEIQREYKGLRTRDY